MVPLNDELEVRRPPWATQLQSSATQENKHWNLNSHILQQLVEKKKVAKLWESVYTNTNKSDSFDYFQVQDIMQLHGTIKILWLAPYQPHLYLTHTVTLAVRKYFNNNNLKKKKIATRCFCKTQVQLLGASCLVTAPVSSSLCHISQCDVRFLFFKSCL